MTIQSDEMIHLTFEKFFQKYTIFNHIPPVAIAVSGGPDSMSLLQAMSKTYLGNIFILCVNHGLRKSVQSEIDKIEKWVKSQNNNNLSFHVLNWQGDKPNSAIMEAARFARYDLLAQFCEENNVIDLFVGHHQDDQAETFLMRLINGSGIDGLAAIQEKQPYKNITIYRPFLSHSKQDLIQYCDRNEIPYSLDPSNENNKYLRPRLRQCMEILEGEGLTSKRLANTAKRMARGRKALETMTLQAINETLVEELPNKVTLEFKNLKKYPEEIGFRVLKNYIENFRPTETYHVRMEKLEDLFESLWLKPNEFKPRTLGGCKISITKNSEILLIEKE